MDTSSLCLPETDSPAPDPMDTEDDPEVEEKVEKETTENATIPEPHSYFVNTALQQGQPALVSQLLFLVAC